MNRSPALAVLGSFLVVGTTIAVVIGVISVGAPGGGPRDFPPTLPSPRPRTPTPHQLPTSPATELTRTRVIAPASRSVIDTASAHAVFAEAFGRIVAELTTPRLTAVERDRALRSFAASLGDSSRPAIEALVNDEAVPPLTRLVAIEIWLAINRPEDAEPNAEFRSLVADRWHAPDSTLTERVSAALSLGAIGSIEDHRQLIEAFLSADPDRRDPAALGLTRATGGPVMSLLASVLDRVPSTQQAQTLTLLEGVIRRTPVNDLPAATRRLVADRLLVSSADRNASPEQRLRSLNALDAWGDDRSTRVGLVRLLEQEEDLVIVRKISSVLSRQSSQLDDPDRTELLSLCEGRLDARSIEIATALAAHSSPAPRDRAWAERLALTLNRAAELATLGNSRRRAVLALAHLPSASSHSTLERIELNDRDSSVRRAAAFVLDLWVESAEN